MRKKNKRAHNGKYPIRRKNKRAHGGVYSTKREQESLQQWVFYEEIKSFLEEAFGAKSATRYQSE